MPDIMTSLERVRAVLAGALPDRVPVCLLSFQNAAWLAGYSVGEYCQDGDKIAAAQLAYWDAFRHDIIDIENGVAAMAEAVGCGVEYHDDADRGAVAVPQGRRRVSDRHFRPVAPHQENVPDQVHRAVFAQTTDRDVFDGLARRLGDEG